MPPMPVPMPVGPPIKATPAIYESPPMPPASQLQQTQQTAYDYQQYPSDQQQYAAGKLTVIDVTNVTNSSETFR